MIRNFENRMGNPKIHNRCDRGSLCVFFRMEREKVGKQQKKEGFYKYAELKAKSLSKISFCFLFEGSMIKL